MNSQKIFVGGKYRIGKRIGGGAFGEIYKGKLITFIYIYRS